MGDRFNVVLEDLGEMASTFVCESAAYEQIRLRLSPPVADPALDG